MLRFCFGAIFIGVVLALSLAGFRGTSMKHTPIEWFNDMAHQPRFDPQHTSNLFADSRAARQPVVGTIPMGYEMPKGLDNQAAYFQIPPDNLVQGGGFTMLPDYYNTGRMGEFFGDGIPKELSSRGDELLKRGHERFDIFCSACHGKAGAGDGVVKSFGLMTVRSLVDDQIKGQPDGQIYNTLTHGKNTMGAQGPLIAVEDRWAIVAYVRALQRVQGLQSAGKPNP
jgi:mono/diheme cytochrome c family protein